MKKILVLSILFSFPAQAMDFVIGTGFTKYQKPANGVYYQEGYPYTLELNGTPYVAGIAFNRDNLRYRLEFDQLGQAHTMCLAASDSAYMGYGKQNANLVKLQGNGNITGAVASVARETKLFGGNIYGEAGIFIYRQNWKVKVSNLEGQELATVTHTQQMEFRPVIGVGYRYGNIDVNYRFLMIDSHRDDLPFVSGNAQSLTLRVGF